MDTFIKFGVEVREWVTSPADPKDAWSNDSTDADVSIGSAVKVREDGYHTLCVHDKDLPIGCVVYLVWAGYSTGDSFSHHGGQYELLEVFDNREEAENRAQYYAGVKDYSVPWNGYFESLEGVFVDALILT